MAVTLTRNLKLRLDSNLTANSKYNLERLDTLGSTFIVDTTDSLNLRSKTDILIQPNSADIGGSGTGGSVSIGTPSQLLSALTVYSSVFNLSSLSLLDQASGGTAALQIQYKSDTNGSVDPTNRSLFIDVDGANRSLVLGGNLTTSGGTLVLSMSGTTRVTLPLMGTLSTLDGVETLTNKSINAASNTLTNISNSAISSSAGIVYSKLNLSGGILGADISPSAAIGYSKLSIVNSVVDSDISSSAAISRVKLATGSANQVLINDIFGQVSSEAQLAATRGGTGISSTATFPTSGTILTGTNTVTVSHKSISGSVNTLSNIAYSALLLSNSLVNADISSSAAIAYSKLLLSDSIVNADISSSAAIAYSKLNLTASIANADVSNSAAIAYSKLALTGSLVNADVSASAAIAGTKINPDFGNQLIKSDQGIQFATGGYNTRLREAPSGQSTNLDFRLPNSTGTAGQVLTTDGSGILDWLSVGGTGTVTSVALAAPAEFSVSGSPVTTAGTLTLAWASEAANKVLAGPTSGGSATPSFRSLVQADLNVVGNRKLAANWVTADGTTLTITHNWGTQKIAIEVLDNPNNYATIDVSTITRPSSNTVVLTSTEAPASTWTVLLNEIG